MNRFAARCRLGVLLSVSLTLVACGTFASGPADPVGTGDHLARQVFPEGWVPLRSDMSGGPWAGPAPGVLPKPDVGRRTGKPSRPDLGFEPTDEDRATLGGGFTGVRAAPPNSGYGQGIALAVADNSPAESAGLKTGDLLMAVGPIRFAADDDDPIGTYRDGARKLRPETDVEVVYFRKKVGVVKTDLRLGRAARRFDRFETPQTWLAAPRTDPALEEMIARATDLDGGRDRYLDTLARNRKRMSTTDWFRLADLSQVHLHPAAQEIRATALTDGVAWTPLYAAYVAAGYPRGRVADPPSVEGRTVEALVAGLEAFLVARHRQLQRDLTSWSPEERALVTEGFPRLTEQIASGNYLHDDEDVDRQRTNRRIIALLSQVDRTVVLEQAERVGAYLRALLPELARAVRAENKPGLILARNTEAGRIEVWGSGNQRHRSRCAFRFDLSGNDVYADVGGRADPDRPVSIQVDWEGDDLYGATSPFAQGSALLGIGILMDREGDDQYLATEWSQGVGVAGFGLLADGGGNDTYRGNVMCQGLGFVGGGVVWDADGNDTYSGDRFCQGVGFGAGVGAVVDHGGDDRYSCTGRFLGEYGDRGVFSGWGQGVGFGFRHVNSGGIGVLHDRAGRDVYEAGNFSQGGGYFFGWGILRDDSGDDRYLGSRYAQGFAAHQADGTFLELAGNDHYQSHWGVAQGLSWDETTVVFHDYAGDDVYESRGFSRAAAAHNAVAILLDDGGDDVYETLPGQARSNAYHGGHSFSLFVDRGGGRDVYGDKPAEEWNDRAAWKHQGAYHLDLPSEDRPVRDLVRPEIPETDRKP